MIPPRFSFVSGLNMIISSSLLRNSGLNDALRSAMTLARASSLISPSGVIPSSSILASEVGGEDYYSILEVNGSALAVGDSAVVKNLEQDIEHVGMRLFDLIEQYYTVRMTSYGFGELPPPSSYPTYPV